MLSGNDGASHEVAAQPTAQWHQVLFSETGIAQNYRLGEPRGTEHFVTQLKVEYLIKVVIFTASQGTF